MEKLSLFLGLLCFIQICKLGFCQKTNGVAEAAFTNVISFGAAGDGKTDDSPAFLKAWEAVCKGGNGKSTLFVPGGRIYMLKPLTFLGPCKTPTVTILVKGQLMAPGYTWDVRRYGTWIGFENVNGLTLTGGGIINGRGSSWWRKVQDRPSSMHFHRCDGLRLFLLRFIDSPRIHIAINGAKNVDVSKVSITAPDHSPNTDGIDIANSKGVNIHDSIIATGDDCIAINTGTSFVTVTRIFCGPGHGISIGSLGEKGAFETVEEVRVKNCTLTNTTNGVRIKTYRNGSGYARKISFENIRIVASMNPIIIDQNYMNKGNEGSNGVKVSDIRFERVYGTSASKEAITLKCNKNLGCKNIRLHNVDLKSVNPGQMIHSVCDNAYGMSSYVEPSSCLRN